MSFDHLEFEEALPLLSTPACREDPSWLSRRRFLQGALAAAAGASLPAVRARAAAAAEVASPLAAGDGVIVVVFLGGGNDGLNTVVPMSGASRAHYDRHRASLAISGGDLLPLGSTGWGFHPALVNLQRRYRAGRVAVVQGVGLPKPDLSHFTATASMMRGAVSGVGPGWLGSYLDHLSDSPSGLRGVYVGSSVPLYLQGARSHVTSVPSAGPLWGADRSDSGEGALIDAVAGFGLQPSGLGPMGDKVAAAGASTVANAQRLNPALAADAGAPGPVRDLTVAARLINLDLGARVLGVTYGGWDTHAAQAGVHDAQLRALDAAIEAFFGALTPSFQRRVTMLVQSEFGRRPAVNGALGTDHGTAAPMFVIGENVAGGLHGAPSDLARLDDRGNPAPTVDFRAVYAAILDGWLAADARQVLGARTERLDLFAARPGRPRA